MRTIKNRRPSRAARTINASLLRLRAAIGTDEWARVMREHVAIVAAVTHVTPEPERRMACAVSDRTAGPRSTSTRAPIVRPGAVQEQP